MPVLMPTDTTAAQGAGAKQCESRSLFLDRFADPAAKDLGDQRPRRDWFDALRAKGALPGISAVRHGWMLALPVSGRARLLYAQLQSRLMVNMAGGVMENAGLCLDRFGLPYIPGSAVKGCARRMAIQELLEADTPAAKAGIPCQSQGDYSGQLTGSVTLTGFGTCGTWG